LRDGVLSRRENVLRRDVQDVVKLVTADLFMIGFCMSPCSSEHIIISGRCRALVGGLFFRHRLLVAPSAPLDLAIYMRGLAQDCLRESFPEFTRCLVLPLTRQGD